MKRITSVFLVICTVASLFSFNVAATQITSADFSAEELDSSKYDLRKYTAPFWEGNIVYNECVFPITDENGNVPLFELMYEATEIVSVTDYRFVTTYVEGEDYLLTDGKLEITNNSRIKVKDHSELHPIDNPNNYDWTVYYPHADGEGYEYWEESSAMSVHCICVTYIHNDTWDATVPHNITAELPSTMDKLVHKKPLHIVAVGDSVTGGALASSSLGISPSSPPFVPMTVNGLRAMFGNDNIKLTNSAIGGTISEYDEQKVQNTILRHSPDLVLINFGMNDSSCDRVGLSDEVFTKNIEDHISAIKAALPECEILLVSSLYGNRYTFPAERYESHARILEEIAAKYDGVAACNPQKIEKDLLEKKDFLDFMADNMVHPNDLGMRLMAQTILYAFCSTDMDSFRADVMADLSAYAQGIEATGTRKDMIEKLLGSTEEMIASLDSEWDISDEITKAYEAINSVKDMCADDAHTMERERVEATCTDDGYVREYCTGCIYSVTLEELPALGGEHFFDSGRQTVSPTYTSSGVFTEICNKCGAQRETPVPALSDAPETEGGMLFIGMGYNYMQTNSIKPFPAGTGAVEFDLCPLSLSDEMGIPFAGVYFSGYSYCACYNFATQQFEIRQSGMPYNNASDLLASAPYEWTVSGGGREYNWHKIAFSFDKNEVSIYLDGVLMLSHTSSVYDATGLVALPYTTGEFYMDNFVVATGKYDATTGSGRRVESWDLDSKESVDAFRSEWGLGGYTDVLDCGVTEADRSTATYADHVHAGDLIGSVEGDCLCSGYDEMYCRDCGTVYLENKTEPKRNGHKPISYSYDSKKGAYVYECFCCPLTVSDVVPESDGYVPYPIAGDVDGNGKMTVADVSMILRHLAEYEIDGDLGRGDVTEDGITNMKDAMKLVRYIAGWREYKMMTH